MSNIRPLQDRLIVRRLDSEEKTAGGLYIPDSAKEKPQQGEVVAVGKGKVKEDGTVIPMDIKKGAPFSLCRFLGVGEPIARFFLRGLGPPCCFRRSLGCFFACLCRSLLFKLKRLLLGFGNAFYHR